MWEGEGTQGPPTVSSRTQVAGRRDAARSQTLRPAFVSVGGIATPGTHLWSDSLVCQSRVSDVLVCVCSLSTVAPSAPFRQVATIETQKAWNA